MSEYRDEILELVSEKYPEYRDCGLSAFKQILGGADTTIFSFDLVSDSHSLPFILRIYRPQASGTGRKEFRVLQNLYARGVGVPRPYIYNGESSVTGRAYIIMERIDGPLLSEELLASQSTHRFNELVEMFVRNLVAIHSVDWTEGLGFLDRMGIAEDPQLFITNELTAPRRTIKEHRIGALLPVIDWMETNQVGVGPPVLLHADYHGLNNLVRPSDGIATIDWANTRLGDCRYDLSFAVMFLSSMGFDVREEVVAQYQSLSGKKVQELEYFMVLSSLWNLLRIYSSVFNHRIMSETEETASLFQNEYRDYAIRVVRTTQDVTGVSLQELADALE